MMMARGEQYLKSLELPEALHRRIFCRVPPSPQSRPASEEDEKGDKKDENKKQAPSKFVLYLPTVVLRKRHNAGFAFACRVANHYQVPVVVLATILDDQHLSQKPLSPISMTARRLAFTLEALQDCCQQWENHGAAVAIRIHGPKCRNPHHLTMIAKKYPIAVVNDEPFVNPYRTYLRRVTIACQSARIPCYSVDGSTTVPPKSILRLSTNQQSVPPGDFKFDGAPNKAWIWEKQTNPNRKLHVNHVVKDGHLNAPELDIKLPSGSFLRGNDANDSSIESVVNTLSAEWNKPNLSGPGQRPWTVSELMDIRDIKKWVMTSWPGADTSVSPCHQTNGSFKTAQERWEYFRDSRLKTYAKKRNNICDPHAVSRMSCYLNLGILSVFDVVHDVWEVAARRTGCSGARKYLDEVIKWREIGYVHTFASPNYHSVDSIPRWSRTFLERQHEQQSFGRSNNYAYQDLESSSTNDATWNAMQTYLVETGELHNNARMTWGKTVVHWQSSRCDPADVLWQLICLNDRYALDGLSPPSYAGILWCFGWCDKPGAGGSLTTKWAYRYRKGADGFEEAKEFLYQSPIVPKKKNIAARTNSSPLSTAKKPRLFDKEKEHGEKIAKSPSILNFFSPVQKKESESSKGTFKNVVG